MINKNLLNDEFHKRLQINALNNKEEKLHLPESNFFIERIKELNFKSEIEILVKWFNAIDSDPFSLSEDYSNINKLSLTFRLDRELKHVSETPDARGLIMKRNKTQAILFRISKISRNIGSPGGNHFLFVKISHNIGKLDYAVGTFKQKEYSPHQAIVELKNIMMCILVEGYHEF